MNDEKALAEIIRPLFMDIPSGSFEKMWNHALDVAKFAIEILKPAILAEALKEGWLPPCERRKIIEGMTGSYNCDQCGMPFEINNELLAKDGAMDIFRGRSIRLIIDPLPEKEKT